MRDHDPNRLALRAQCFCERKAAAQRVAVGVLVPEDQDLLVPVDQRLELIEVPGV
jgi:hypothetical protein